MKKILALVTGLLFAAFSYGQSTVVFTDAGDGYDKAATTSFNFIFSPVHSKDDIMSNAAYYESYFSTTVETAGSAGNTVTLSLVGENPEMERRVIMRLLVNMDVDQINVNGTEMERNDFMNTYIMIE